MLRPRKSRFSGFVELCLQTERREEIAEAEVLCSESDTSGLSVSWNKGPFNTDGGRCIKWLRVGMVGSRVRVVLQILSSCVWGQIVKDGAQALGGDWDRAMLICE